MQIWEGVSVREEQWRHVTDKVICYVMFIFLFFFILILPVNFYLLLLLFFFPFLFFSHTSCTFFPTNKPLHPQYRRRIILEYEGALYRIEVEVQWSAVAQW